MKRRYASPKEFGRLTGWSMATVYRRLEAGALPAIQPGGRRKSWRIDLDAFDKRTQESADTSIPKCPSGETEVGSGPTSEEPIQLRVAGTQPTARLSGAPPRWLRYAK